MIPSKEQFSIMMQNLGINNQDQIIIYDNSPLLSSARAWFLFRYFGHKNIFILNGGLKNWKKNGGEITNKKTIISTGNFQSNTEKKNLVVDLNQMISFSDNNSKLILDARSYKRFTGEAKEPRPGLDSGHIPNSKSLPSSDLVTNDGFLKSIEELDKIFSNNNFNNSEQIIATCGSGVSACVISVALYCLGKEDVPIYDGSWTEWASSGQKIKKG
jgi:thiosulfate/3-mercaptopyruvate sulfurtransferase